MKKKVLIYSLSMEIGGIETSLIGLLNSIDYSKYDVDLFIEDINGVMKQFIPNTVNILDIKNFEGCLWSSGRLLKSAKFKIILNKFKAKIFYRKSDYFFKIRELILKKTKKLEKKYDIALSFFDYFNFIAEKVDASVKVGWLHTDYSQVPTNVELMTKMCASVDYVASISQSSLDIASKMFGISKEKGIVIENILSPNFVRERANASNVDAELSCDGLKIMSVGRYTRAKNFDNVPFIARELKKLGLKFKWFLMGYGLEEPLIKSKIAEAGMEDVVIMLGKRENPYPYMKASDIYIQPSRFEGKAVTVREAQILAKPVIITDFNTSKDQVINGFDGIIVPLNNEECAKAIYQIVNDKQTLEMLIRNCKDSEYGNEQEVEKIYSLIK